ncbi:MAG: GGDEF domain-containing protein [Ruminococcus sp.]|nr:GGDEF domain-containing protein [Ruminococcus sp.]
MKKEGRRFSIKMKMYIFVVIAVIVVAVGTSVIAFRTSADQIERYYKNSANDNAKNFASMVDGDFLEKLKAEVASDEFQQLRARAEEAGDDEPVKEYLISHGLWDKYSEIRSKITRYLENMDDIKYLYIVAHGSADAEQDMYLIDDESIELTETGYYEDREEELLGQDIAALDEPMISHGDWGWLCSAFKPVYNSAGECVCIVGCDFGMDDVMKERTRLLILLVIGSVIFTVVVLAGSMLFINKVVVKPLNAMTTEMKKFNPSENMSYDQAGVIDLDIRSRDEIGEIYNGIRSLETDITDRINEMADLIKAKLKAENEARDKDEQIGRLSIETYRDALTGVNNKAAYIKKAEELNEQLGRGGAEFAFVMVDMNNLKRVNDDYGHRAGDLYIKGCCRMVCEAFKHSPVYRIGGDEFVVILQGPDYNDRKRIVEKLKQDYEQCWSNTSAEAWQRYSAAVGMAENASDDLTVELVFKRADKAMYEHKSKFKAEHGGTSR